MSHAYPGPDTPQQPEPKRKSWFRRHKVLTALGIIAALFIVGSALGSGGSDPGTSGNSTASSSDTATEDTIVDDTPAPPANDDEGTVEIIVKSSGSKSGSVTYVKPGSDSFDMSQDTSASLPWHKRFKADDLVPGWNMNAQQNGGGKLTCIVKQDGKVIAKNTSNGQYSMVTCAP